MHEVTRTWWNCSVTGRGRVYKGKMPRNAAHLSSSSSLKSSCHMTDRHRRATFCVDARGHKREGTVREARVDESDLIARNNGEGDISCRCTMQQAGRWPDLTITLGLVTRIMPNPEASAGHDFGGSLSEDPLPGLRRHRVRPRPSKSRRNLLFVAPITRCLKGVEG